MATRDWTGQTITALGLSRSGAAVARYVASRGGRVLLSETVPASANNEALRVELEALGVEIEMGGHTEKVFSHADCIVVSPGIPPHSEIIEQLRLSGKEMISEVEFAWREAPELPIIAVTGTNGKSTTTTLISHILTQAGYWAPACGNIGLPVTDVINLQAGQSRPDFLVIELSSFQIEFSPTLKPKVGIFTNFKPDHIDWHGSVDAYREAKLRLFTGARAPEWSVALADDPACRQIAGRSPGQCLWFSRQANAVAKDAHKAYLDAERRFVLDPETPERLFSADDLQIIGDHNEENVLASMAAAWLVGVNPPDITRGCLSFAGLEHRLERVAELATKSGAKRVTFWNDSKATNTDAAISALRAFKTERVILIAGGYDKMTPLEEFVDEVKAHAGTVILIGKAKERFAQALADAQFTSVVFEETLESAVARGYALSNGEPVLLSPACASFDMFKNFEERGRAFKAAVLALQAAQPAVHS